MGLRCSCIGGPANDDWQLGGLLEQLHRSPDLLLCFGQGFADVCFRRGPESLEGIVHRFLGARKVLPHRAESRLGYSGAAIPYFDADAGFWHSGALSGRVPTCGFGVVVLMTACSASDDCLGAPTWHFASCYLQARVRYFKAACVNLCSEK